MKHEFTDNIKFDTFYCSRWARVDGLPEQVPISIMHILANDSIEMLYYEFNVKDHKYKVTPSLYIGKISSEKRQELSILIQESDLSKRLEKMKNCSSYSYAISITFNDSTIMAECLDSNLFDNKLNALINFSSGIADTVCLIETNYFVYFGNKGYDLPPFPFEEYLEINY